MGIVEEWQGALCGMVKQFQLPTWHRPVFSTWCDKCWTWAPHTYLGK